MNGCKICPHNCQINRITELGICNAPANFKIAHIQLHKWEEPCISGFNGSGTIFFSHCNLKCVFCQNYEISQLGQGKIVSESDFLHLCQKLKDQGAHNLDFVTPTAYSHLLIKLLPEIKQQTDMPIIWNSNAYEKVETLTQLQGLVDVYLPDLKYSNNDLAIKYSQAPNYFPIALAAIKEMVRQVPDIEVDENGLIKKGVIIRHLVLPFPGAAGDRVSLCIGYFHTGDNSDGAYRCSEERNSGERRTVYRRGFENQGCCF